MSQYIARTERDPFTCTVEPGDRIMVFEKGACEAGRCSLCNGSCETAVRAFKKGAPQLYYAFCETCIRALALAAEIL